MPDTAVNRRRGTTAQHATFTGALGETTYDTDLQRLVTHDGVLAGGYPVAMLHVANIFSRTQTVNSTDSLLIDLQKSSISRAVISGTGFMQLTRQEPDISQSGIDIRKRGTTGNALAALSSGSGIGEVEFNGWDGAAFGAAGHLRFFATEAWTGIAHGSKLFFSTTPAGTTAVAVHATLDSTRLNILNGPQITVTKTALGTTVTDGLLLENTTAAAVGAQQNSPAFDLSGFGWGTTAGTSQSVRWREYLLPVQSTIPLAQLTWAYTIAGGTETLGMSLRDNGTFRVFFPVGGIGTAQMALVESGSTNAWARLNGSVAFGGAVSFSDGTTTQDASVRRFAANHINISSAALAQTFSVANTATSATNYEMLFTGWTANVAHIWTEKGSGGGTARDFALGADATEVIRFTSASMQMATAKTLAIASGANQRAGNATLIAGTITVANTTVTANTIVLLTRKTSGGTIGLAITYTVIAATSFTITSDSAIDTSTFSYMLVEVP